MTFATTRQTPIPQSRKLIPSEQMALLGLDLVTPHDLMGEGRSPFLTDVRIFTQGDDDRRVSVITRKGPGGYSVPVGEAEDDSEVSTTGAVDQTISKTAWLAQKFTNSSENRLTKVDLRIKTPTDSVGHIIIEIRADNSGEPASQILAQSSILNSETSDTYTYLSAKFIEAPLLASATDYWIVVYVQDAGSTTGTYNISSTTNSTDGLSSNNSGGTWSSLAASLNFKTYMSTNGAIKGIGRYYPTNGENETLFAHGSSVYSIDDVTGAVNSLISSLNASATDYYFDFADDKTFLVNGVDVPQKYDGDTVENLGGYPGISKYMAVHKNRTFFVPTSDPTRINFSDLGDYETYGATSFIYVPTPKSTDPITGVLSFQDVLVIYTRKTKYLLYGSDLSNFVLRQAIGGKGAVRQDAIDKDENYAYALANDGIYRFNGSEDELVSDKVRPEIDNMADKKKASLRVWNRQVRLYYPTSGSSSNNRMLLLDTTLSNDDSPYGEWMLDTNTYIDKTVIFTQDDNELVEASSLAGFLMYAEQDYSNLGKKIDFIYHTKYNSYDEPAANKQVRRLYPILRTQSEPFSITIQLSRDFKVTSQTYSVNTIGTGVTRGGGAEYGDGSVYGKTEMIDPRIILSGQAKYWQYRFIKSGVNTPIELLGYVVYYRLKKAR